MNEHTSEPESLEQSEAHAEDDPLDEWRSFYLKVADRWSVELENLEGFIHFSSSIGRIYVYSALTSLGKAQLTERTSPKERARNLIFALGELQVKSSSCAGAILAVLQHGYVFSALALCRTLQENYIVSEFLRKFDEQDAAERYVGSIAIQFANGRPSEDAKLIYDRYAAHYPDAKEHGWASGIDGRKRWTIRDMAEAVELGQMYELLFKRSSRYIHPDPSTWLSSDYAARQPPIHALIQDLNPSALYGQTADDSIAWTACEVAKYLAGITLPLTRVWPIENGETLTSEYEDRCRYAIDLLEHACEESLRTKPVSDHEGA